MNTKTSSTPKRILKTILIILLVLVLIVAGYIAYVFIDYHRIPDGQELTVSGNASSDIIDVSSDSFHMTGWNIGFGAYTDDFSFFMDGGESSRAVSKEANIENMEAIISELRSFDSDFYLIQEVDFGSTRSYQNDQVKMICQAFEDSYDSTFGVNYDSPYLFYPITEPIGASKSGILTLSGTDITDSTRRSLPIQTDLAKFLDLDRCFTVNRIPCSNGKELILLNAPTT